MLTHKTAFSSFTCQNYGTSMFLNTEKLLVSHSMRPVACSAEKCKEQGKSSKNKSLFLLFRP